MELTDPRALALGGAFITDDRWSQGSLVNPACAAGSGMTAGASMANHIVDMWSGRLMFSHPIMRKNVLGGYITTFNYGKFDISEVGKGLTGTTFYAAEYIFAAYGAGRYRDRFTWGLALKYIHGDIDFYKADGIAVDLGTTFDPGLYNFKFGAALRNYGKQLSGYGSNTDPLPRELLLGVTTKLSHLPLMISTVFQFARDGEGEWDVEFLPGNPGFSFGAGGEFEVPTMMLKKPLLLRLGYRSRGMNLRVGQKNDMLAGMSFGIGIPYRRYDFEYAFAMMGALGNIHRFGFSVSL